MTSESKVYEYNCKVFVSDTCGPKMPSIVELPFSFSFDCFPLFRRKEELGEGKEKVTISEDCELVTLMSVIKGRLEVTRAYVCFWDAGLGEDGERTDFKWSLNQLQEVHLRRYNLRRSALEFFLTDQTNYFVNFTTKVLFRMLSGQTLDNNTSLICRREIVSIVGFLVCVPRIFCTTAVGHQLTFFGRRD